MSKQKVGKDETRPGAYRFRLTNDIPIGSGLAEVTDESFFELAIEVTPLFGSGDWVAGGEREIERLAAYDAGRPQREATGRDERWNNPRQRTTVQERAAKKRIRPRNLEKRRSLSGWRPYRADEAAQLCQANERPRAAFCPDATEVALKSID